MGQKSVESYDEKKTEAAKFKAPTANTPKEVVERWEKEDKDLFEYLETKLPAVLEHTGAAAFDDHLKGVEAVLRFWGAADHVITAGLLHSIYGTEGFQGFSLPLSERKKIEALIGPKAEAMVFKFCMMDRYSFDETVFAWKETTNGDESNHPGQYTFKARPEMGRFDITNTKEEWLEMVELVLCDWLEQVEGAAMKPSPTNYWKEGESYCYRRLAYKRMSEILAVERASRLKEIAPNMYKAVFSTESEQTRDLVQARTVPKTEAAITALVALRSIGEPIPEDYNPKPVTKQ